MCLFGWWFIFGDCSYNSFYFLYQCLHFFYKLGNYFRFCGCLLHSQFSLLMKGIFFLSLLRILLFLSFFLLLDMLFFLVCFLSGNFFFFLPYFTIFRPGTGFFGCWHICSLFGSLYVCHIPHIFCILVVVYTGLGVQTSDICSILMDLGSRVLHLFFGIQI